jgi:uncharacterized protein (DUF885 family)
VHYQQLALSWRHPRPVRRHYYDCGANEGIAFYNEEMMLVSGLLDDAPHTRTVVCNFMRLRALRVTVDLGLATGALSIATAAGDLAAKVPMDEATARDSGPGRRPGASQLRRDGPQAMMTCGTGVSLAPN